MLDNTRKENKEKSGGGKQFTVSGTDSETETTRSIKSDLLALERFYTDRQKEGGEESCRENYGTRIKEYEKSQVRTGRKGGLQRDI